MPSLSVGGLASGLDSDAIVAQLMAAERAPRNRLDLQSRQTTARQTALQDIQGKLTALQTAVANLKSTSLFANVQSLASSDATRVGATRTAGAPAGGFTVSVSQLATAAYATGTWTPPGAATTITVDGHDTAVAAGATIDDAVSAINSDAAATAWASNVGGQLVLSHRQTGTAVALTASSPALSGVTVVAGQQAQYAINGGAAQTSDSNEITSAIPGVTLSLKGVTSSPVTVSVGVPGPDPDAITAKAKSFVDAYNAVVDVIRAKTGEQKVRDPQTDADRMKGLLQGDTMLTGLLGQLRVAATSAVAGLPDGRNELADIGISTGAASGTARFSDASVAGRLTFDEAKFRAALAADPAGVKDLLGVTGAGGAGAALANVLTPALSADGTMDSRLSSTRSRITDLGRQMAAMDDRLALKEKGYKAMFARLETALAASQAQQQWLSGQLAALDR